MTTSIIQGFNGTMSWLLAMTAWWMARDITRTWWPDGPRKEAQVRRFTWGIRLFACFALANLVFWTGEAAGWWR